MSEYCLANGFQTVRENCLNMPSLEQQHELFYNGKDYDGRIGYNIVYSLDIHNYENTVVSDADILTLLQHARDNNIILNIFAHNIKLDGSPALAMSYSTLQMICEFINANKMTFYRLCDLNATKFGY